MRIVDRISFKHVLTMVIVILAFALVGLLFFIEPPEANRETVTLIAGIVAVQGLGGVFKYWFNSNDQSEKKTDIIAHMKMEKHHE